MAETRDGFARMPEPVSLSPDHNDIVTLSIGSSHFEGWTHVNVTLGLDQAAGTFKVKIAEAVNGILAGSGLQLFNSRAEPDTPCTVSVNGELCITGNIDTREAEKEPDKHTVEVSGRSKTRQAIDSDHIDEKAQYNDQKPSQIAKKVAEKLDLKVKVEVDKERPIEWFRYDLGERAISIARRAARKQGITVTDDEQGNMLLINKFSKAAPAALIAGANLLKWKVTKSVTGRNSKYHARGQKVPNGKRRGKKANQVAARATDSGIKTKRPRYVIGDGDTDDTELKDRVGHEAARRAGHSLKVECVVKGWTANGKLWRPGQLAMTVIPDEGVRKVLLIERVVLEKHPDKPGTRATISLTERAAYEKGKSKGGAKSSGASAGGGRAASAGPANGAVGGGQSYGAEWDFPSINVQAGDK